MKVWIVRHGESETNQNGLWTGLMDVSLTEKGIQDAKAASRFMEGQVFDKVYSSALKRARQTLETILPGQMYEVTPLLNEIDVGTLTGKPLDIISKEEKKLADIEGFHPYQGESREELCSRILKIMQELEVSGYRNVALFTHRGWLKMFLHVVTDIPLSIENILCENGMTAIFTYQNGTWNLHSWMNVNE